MDLVHMIKEGFDAYQQFSQAHPVLSAMATAEVFFPAGDLVSQVMHRKFEPKKTLYTALLAPAYGLTMHALIGAGNNMGHLWEAVVEKGAEWNYALTKAALGPNLEGLMFNAVFFLNNKLGQRANYNPVRVAREYGSLTDHPDVLKTSTGARWKSLRKNLNNDKNIPREEFLWACLGSLTVWNAFHTANYAWVPDELRTPISLVAAFGWTCVLSYRSSKDLRKDQL